MITKLLPEEAVRQSIIETLVAQGFPRHLMSVEKKVPGLRRRLDLLCHGLFSGKVRPLLLVECKAIKLTKAAERQVTGYNYHVRAPFVAVVNGDGMLFAEKGGQFTAGVPTYEELWKRFVVM
jgi:hypothetical protein